MDLRLAGLAWTIQEQKSTHRSSNKDSTNLVRNALIEDKPNTVVVEVNAANRLNSRQNSPGSRTGQEPVGESEELLSSGVDGIVGTAIGAEPQRVNVTNSPLTTIGRLGLRRHRTDSKKERETGREVDEHSRTSKKSKLKEKSGRNAESSGLYTTRVERLLYKLRPTLRKYYVTYTTA